MGVERTVIHCNRGLKHQVELAECLQAGMGGKISYSAATPADPTTFKPHSLGVKSAKSPLLRRSSARNTPPTSIDGQIGNRDRTTVSECSMTACSYCGSIEAVRRSSKGGIGAADRSPSHPFGDFDAEEA